MSKKTAGAKAGASKRWGLGGLAVLSVLATLPSAPCFAQTQSDASRYVDHDTAVKMGSVGNYVSENELKAYQDRIALQESLKRQLSVPEKTVSLPSDQTVVFFKAGQTQLTSKGEEEVNRIAQQVLDDKSLVAVIGGFTDNVGEGPNNQQLSKERADAVKNELLGLGVSDRQIRTEAFGESEPIASNASDQGRAMNRRAEVTVEDFTQTIG